LSVSRGAVAAVVNAEPGLLGQVGKNLTGNALKFTPRGGHIQLSVSVEGDKALLRVRDSGLGIPAADQPHVFDRFYRSSHAARTVPASGLGLALVKRIADAHGWTVGLSSRPGEGTDVWVEMPLASEAEPPA
jgi:signal transduction histidine kinase